MTEDLAPEEKKRLRRMAMLDGLAAHPENMTVELHTGPPPTPEGRADVIWKTADAEGTSWSDMPPITWSEDRAEPEG